MTKLPYIAAALAVIGSTAALADDQQLQARLSEARARETAIQPAASTIAVYVDHRGLSQRYTERVEVVNETPDLRFELRDNGHGQLRGAYVVAQ